MCIPSRCIVLSYILVELFQSVTFQSLILAGKSHQYTAIVSLAIVGVLSSFLHGCEFVPWSYLVV